MLLDLLPISLGNWGTSSVVKGLMDGRDCGDLRLRDIPVERAKVLRGANETRGSLGC